jgi:hypothetical protein
MEARSRFVHARSAASPLESRTAATIDASTCATAIHPVGRRGSGPYIMCASPDDTTRTACSRSWLASRKANSHAQDRARAVATIVRLPAIIAARTRPAVLGKAPCADVWPARVRARTAVARTICRVRAKGTARRRAPAEPSTTTTPTTAAAMHDGYSYWIGPGSVVGRGLRPETDRPRSLRTPVDRDRASLGCRHVG